MRVEPPLPAADLADVMQATESLWPQLRNARILVTGGTGFFGRWILESLLGANARCGTGMQATVLSRDPARFLERAPHLGFSPELRWVRGSVATLEPRDFSGQHFDAVIHLATEADLKATLDAPLAALDVIANGTRRALDTARQTGASRFLFASSGAVYGPQPPELALIPETFAGAPDSTDLTRAYAIGGTAKLQAERLCEEYARQHGLGVVIARGFTFAGPALPLDGKFAFGNFLRDALSRKTILVEGDGTPVRSYLHAVDLTIWLWTMLLRGVPGRAYNVGSESALGIRELAEAIARELGSPGVAIRKTPKPGEVAQRYVPATQRARDELGLHQTVDLAETIRRTAGWHRSMLKH